MTVKSVTLQLPETLYLRLRQVASGMPQSLDDVLMRAVQVGSPPSWEDAPAAFQGDLAALNRLDDQSLWRIARHTQLDQDWLRYQELLDKNANGEMTAIERMELERLRIEADRFMLRKAHAAALLRWRGQGCPIAKHQPPPIMSTYLSESLRKQLAESTKQGVNNVGQQRARLRNKTSSVATQDAARNLGVSDVS